MFPDVYAHLTNAIGAAPVINDPFTHIYVRDVFPDDFYAEMLANMPEPEKYQALADVGHVSDDYNRSRLIFSGQPKDLGLLPPELAEFWDKLFATLQHTQFINFIHQKFSDTINGRFANPETALEGEHLIGAESFLIRDNAGYDLGPHTDSPAKIVPSLFYLASDEDHAYLGTSFYSPIQEGFTCPGGPYYPFDQFKRTTTAPYLPNTMLAFAKTSDAFHGVENVGNPDDHRDILFFDLKAVPAAVAEGWMNP
jgi:hypothetical protein